MKKIPVILDTDIGCDIDDAWALAMLLNCPELDLKMVLVGTGDVEYRARNAAKMLDAAQRCDVPIGIGVGSDNICNSVETWLQDYPLSKYPGEVFKDGISKACEIITQSSEPVTVIGIGPMTDLAAMLKAEPGVVNNSRLVAMCGSIGKGLDGSEGRVAEWNITEDIAAAQAVFDSGWDTTITPLDTCGQLRLEGELYGKVRQSEVPVVVGLLEQFKIWDEKYSHGFFENKTSILFDAVAVYLAYSEDHLVMKDMQIKLAEDGEMIPEKSGSNVRVAIDWEDIRSFKEHLVKRICG